MDVDERRAPLGFILLLLVVGHHPRPHEVHDQWDVSLDTRTECGSLVDRLNPEYQHEYRLPRSLARGLQFGWQNGDQLANWTGLFNVTDDPAVQSGSDSSSRYRPR